MNPSGLLQISITAFISVFVLLTILALLMRLIMTIYPQKRVTADMAVVAAVTTAVQAMYPGMQITKVEEIK